MSQQSNVGKIVRDKVPGSSTCSGSLAITSHCFPYSPEREIPLYPSTVLQESPAVDLPSQSDIIIAIMGPTGAGKSTFINKAAGIEETVVGHGLESCTSTVQIVRCLDPKRQGRRVVFVDTPGFNDTNKSDLDILQLVADWLKLTYEKNIRLSGLLFFHRISDNRMAGSPLKYLKMFQNLCGNDALKNVVLVTTMWDEVEEEEGFNREKELSDNYWKSMIELGCHTARFYNNAESAWDIISQLQETQCTVLLQEELVDQGLELAETSAGRTLFSWLIDFIKKIKEMLAHIEAKLKQNQSSANRIIVEREKTATQAKLQEADAQRRRYSTGLIRRLSNSRTRSRASSRSRTAPAAMPWTNASSASSSISLTSSPIDYLPPPPSPADGTGRGFGRAMVLQGTITALKLVHQIVGLTPVPSGLQGLVELVLNISELVNNMYPAEDALIELAKKAGSFMVTLVEHGPISSLSDCDAMKSAIEGLTKEMNQVLKVVKDISCTTVMRLSLSPSDKAAVDECNKQMALACGIFGIQIAFISQQAIARIEAKLNMMALKMCDPIPPQSNQQIIAIQRATTY